MLPALLLTWLSSFGLTTYRKYQKELYIFILATLFMFFNYNLRLEFLDNFDIENYLLKNHGEYHLQIANRPKENYFFQSEFEVEIKDASPSLTNSLQEYFVPVKFLAKAKSTQGLEYGDILSIKELDSFYRNSSLELVPVNHKLKVEKLEGFKAKVNRKNKVLNKLVKAELEFVDHKFSWVYTMQKKIKQFYLEKLGAYDGAIVSSLLLGSRVSDMPYDFAQQVRNLGLGHFFAASGFHLLVLSLFLGWVMGIVGLSRRNSSFLIILATLIYSALAGFSPSIIRAAVMLLAFLTLRLLDREVKSLSLLTVLAGLTLLFDPFAIYDIGFQFSYLATFGIIVWMSPIKEKLSKLPDYLADLLSVTIAVQIILLPLIVYYFHSMQVWSIVANVVFSPILSLLVVLSFMGLFFFIKPLIVVAKWIFASAQHLPFLDFRVEIDLSTFVLMSMLLNLIAYFILAKKDYLDSKNPVVRQFKPALFNKYIRASMIFALSFMIIATNAMPPGVKIIDVKNGRISFDNAIKKLPSDPSTQMILGTPEKEIQNIETYKYKGFSAILINDRSKISNLKGLRQAQLLVLPNLNSKDIYMDTILEIVKPQFIITSMKRESTKAKANLNILSSYTHTILNSGRLYVSDKYWSITRQV